MDRLARDTIENFVKDTLKHVKGIDINTTMIDAATPTLLDRTIKRNGITSLANIPSAILSQVINAPLDTYDMICENTATVITKEVSRYKDLYAEMETSRESISKRVYKDSNYPELIVYGGDNEATDIYNLFEELIDSDKVLYRDEVGDLTVLLPQIVDKCNVSDENILDALKLLSNVPENRSLLILPKVAVNKTYNLIKVVGTLLKQGFTVDNMEQDKVFMMNFFEAVLKTLLGNYRMMLKEDAEAFTNGQLIVTRIKNGPSFTKVVIYRSTHDKMLNDGITGLMAMSVFDREISISYYMENKEHVDTMGDRYYDSESVRSANNATFLITEELRKVMTSFNFSNERMEHVEEKFKDGNLSHNLLEVFKHRKDSGNFKFFVEANQNYYDLSENGDKVVGLIAILVAYLLEGSGDK